MDSAGPPGITDTSSAPVGEEDLSPLTDGYDGPDSTSMSSGSFLTVPPVETHALYDDEIIGVSISRVQTQMRSPDTSAAEKARALNLPLDRFQHILTLSEEINDDRIEREPGLTSQAPDENLASSQHRAEEPRGVRPYSEVPSAITEPRKSSCGDVHDSQSFQRSLLPESERSAQPRQSQNLPDQSSKPFNASPVPDAHFHVRENSQHEDEGKDDQDLTMTRSSVTKTLLGGAIGDGRKRSSSGPTAILSNLRKFLPEVSLPHLNRSAISLLPSANKHSEQESPSTFQSRPADACGQVQSLDPMPVTARSHGLDGNVDSLLAPVSPSSTKSRARSNSEGSLYMRRRVSGVSKYDDISAFANVTDMANARFKAITDSFQNSTLRLPRLPAIRPSPKRKPSPERSPAGLEVQSNDRGSSTNGRHQNYQYTNVRQLRNARKGIEVESPQQRAHPILSHALSKTTGDIVLVGGYRGSILRSAEPPHRQLWVPMKVGLNLRKVDLEVGLTREDEERMEETIIPSGILSHIGPIDICRRLIKHLKKCPNTRENKLRVHDWGYDWRLSPDLLSARLIKFLESLECNHPETPLEKRGATVIAHSLGGLITRHAVNQRPDLFAGVVYAGVPQHCVNILGPLRNGDDVLLSSRVLTAQVNFTLRTSFALLPENGRCFIEKHTNTRYDLDFFDPSVWEEYRLSPCINPPFPPSLREHERRKTIMGTLSETISSSRRTSWFGGPLSGEPKQSLDASNHQTAERVLEGPRGVAEDEGEQVVGPSMKQTQYRPTVATTSTLPKEAAKEYLARTLAEVLTFKEQLKFNATHQENNLYPPHAFIFGKTVPTVYGAKVANKEAIKYTDAFDDLAFAAGDGVVLASAAQLPEGYRCVKGGRVETDRGHVGLLGDLEGVGRCLEALSDARAKGVGLGKNYKHHASTSSES